MQAESFFTQAFMYLTAAVISVPIAKRLGLGSVLGYLIAGMVMGPFGLRLIGQEGQDVMHFAEFGVVMMLFLIGLELEPRMLWGLRRLILGMGSIQVAGTGAAGALIAFAAGLPWQSALASGMILSLSSTAIVMQTIEEKGLSKTEAGQSVFGVLLFQDLAVIPMLAVIPLLSFLPLPGSGHGSTVHSGAWLAGQTGWMKTLIVLAAVSVILGAGRFLVKPLLVAIAISRQRELFTAAALLIVIAISLLMTRVGLSPALGAFLAGVVLAECEFRHELVGDIEPFKGLLLGLFFIAVGASIDFGYIIGHPGTMAGLTVLLITGKGIFLFCLGLLFRMKIHQNLIYSFALAQGSEFAFLLFSFAAQQGAMPPETAKPFIAAVAISMAVSPLILLFAERVLLPRVGGKERETQQAPDDIHGENPVILAGFGKFGNTVGRLLRAHNIGVTILDIDSGNVDVLHKHGFRVFYGDAARQDLLAAAGAAKAKMIVIAIDNPDKTLDIVKVVRKHFPHLKIMARAGGRTDATDLIEAGVKHVFLETLDSSLRMGRDALRLLGFRAMQAQRARQMFQMHDEASLQELASHKKEQSAYINMARQKIEDLEDALKRDAAELGENRDLGWDPETLIAAAKKHAEERERD